MIETNTATTTHISNRQVELMIEARLNQNNSGIGGIRKAGNLWQARVMINGTRYQSRGFETKEQAAAWRLREVTTRTQGLGTGVAK